MSRTICPAPHVPGGWLCRRTHAWLHGYVHDIRRHDSLMIIRSCLASGMFFGFQLIGASGLGLGLGLGLGFRGEV